MPSREPLFDPETGKLRDREGLKSISFGDITSTGYHSSTRSYEDSLKRLTDATVERTGFDTQIVRAEPNDPQSRPVDS